MKLLAFAEGSAPDLPGSSRIGLVLSDGILDLGPLGLGDLAAIIDGGEEALERIQELADRRNGDEVPLLDPARVRARAPLRRPGKIVCIGMNYRDHCAEQGVALPAYPMLFAKFANAVSDPWAPVVRPAATEQLDLECELAVVMGRYASHLSADEATAAIFGYTILNDVTMRDLQREDRQWLRAKGSDGLAPMGPLLVTRDEVPDPQRLRLASSVNGETWQDSTTAQMIFDVWTIVAFVSRFIALEPGDVIATGTPAGVGHFHDPPRYLHGGDRMRCEIEGIGVLENPVVDEEPRIADHARAAGLVEALAAGTHR